MDDLKRYIDEYKVSLVYVILIVLLIVYHDKLGQTAPMNKADVYFGGAIFFWAFLQAQIGSWKYGTPQIIADNFHSAHVAGNEYVCGEWVIVSLGDIPLMFQYATEGYLIVHKTTFAYIGTQSFGNVQVTRKEKHFFLPEIQRYIDGYKLGGPYWFGEVSVLSESFINSDFAALYPNATNRPSVSYYQITNDRLCQLVSELCDRLDGKLGVFSKEVDIASNAMHSFNKAPSLKERILGENKQ